MALFGECHTFVLCLFVYCAELMVLYIFLNGKIEGKTGIDGVNFFFAVNCSKEGERRKSMWPDMIEKYMHQEQSYFGLSSQVTVDHPHLPIYMLLNVWLQ